MFGKINISFIIKNKMAMKMTIPAIIIIRYPKCDEKTQGDFKKNTEEMKIEKNPMYIHMHTYIFIYK